MKRFLLIISTLIIASTCIVSCLSDDNKSTANVTYMGKVDSIKFFNEADTVWSQNIVEALQKQKVLYNVFTVSDTVQSGIQDYAVMACNAKAGAIMDKDLKSVTLAQIKKNIFNTHADSLLKVYRDSIAIKSSEDLPLSGFTLHSSLWSFYTGQLVFYYKNIIK